MAFTPAEHAAIEAHATEIGISAAEYIRQSAAQRALAWQRERDAFDEIARRKGVTVQELLARGLLMEEES
jgi:hypothetical protein